MIARSRNNLVVMVIGLVACGRDGRRPVDSPPAAAPAAAMTASAESAIVILGTSLTAGLGLDPDSAYPALLQRKIEAAGFRYRILNAGVSGESSAGALRRIDWVLKDHPAVLLIETGANDGLRGQSPDSLSANIQAMIDRTRRQSPETRIILLGMEALPNLGATYTRRFHDIYPALARKNRLPLVPFLLAGVAGVDSLNQADGIHPNARGAELVADNVWPVLRQALRKESHGQ
jgi:acyl-CoA thioesterase-1